MTSRVRSSHSGAQNNSSNLGSIQPCSRKNQKGKSVSAASSRHLEVTHITSVDILLDQTSHLGEPYFNGGEKLCPQPWRKDSAQTD